MKKIKPMLTSILVSQKKVTKTVTPLEEVETVRGQNIINSYDIIIEREYKTVRGLINSINKQLASLNVGVDDVLSYIDKDDLSLEALLTRDNEISYTSADACGSLNVDAHFYKDDVHCYFSYVEYGETECNDDIETPVEVKPTITIDEACNEAKLYIDVAKENVKAQGELFIFDVIDSEDTILHMVWFLVLTNNLTKEDAFRLIGFISEVLDLDLDLYNYESNYARVIHFDVSDYVQDGADLSVLPDIFLTQPKVKFTVSPDTIDDRAEHMTPLADSIIHRVEALNIEDADERIGAMMKEVDTLPKTFNLSGMDSNDDMLIVMVDSLFDNPQPIFERLVDELEATNIYDFTRRLKDKYTSDKDELEEEVSKQAEEIATLTAQLNEAKMEIAFKSKSEKIMDEYLGAKSREILMSQPRHFASAVVALLHPFVMDLEDIDSIYRNFFILVNHFDEIPSRVIDDVLGDESKSINIFDRIEASHYKQLEQIVEVVVIKSLCDYNYTQLPDFLKRVQDDAFKAGCKAIRGLHIINLKRELEKHIDSMRALNEKINSYSLPSIAERDVATYDFLTASQQKKHTLKELEKQIKIQNYS